MRAHCLGHTGDLEQRRVTPALPLPPSQVATSTPSTPTACRGGVNGTERRAFGQARPLLAELLDPLH